MKLFITLIMGIAIAITANVANADSIVRTDFDFKTNFSDQFEIWSDDLVFTIDGQEVAGEVNWTLDGIRQGTVEFSSPGIQFSDLDPFGQELRYSLGAYGTLQTFGWGPGSNNEEIYPGAPLVVDGVEHFGSAAMELVYEYDWSGRPDAKNELRVRGSGWFASADGDRITYRIDSPLTIQAVPEPSSGSPIAMAVVAAALSRLPHFRRVFIYI